MSTVELSIYLASILASVSDQLRSLLAIVGFILPPLALGTGSGAGALARL